MTMTYCLRLLPVLLCIFTYTSTQKCEDQRAGCSVFKTRKLCNRFKTNLLRRCTLTCGWCDEVYTKEEPCKDNYPACQNVIHFCVPRYRTFLEKHCQKTCNWCEGQQAPTALNWNVWTPCSKTCGAGTRYRVARCPSNNIDTCPKTYEECNLRPCREVTCQSQQDHRYRDTTSCCRRASHNRCGVPQPLSQIGRIIGGRRASVQLWSWMVRIEVRLISGETALCGGSLVDREWVVTTAHCVEPFPIQQITVFVAYQTPSQESFAVQVVHVHPDYSFPTADIAIIKLAKRVTYSPYIQPLCLPRGEISSPEITCFAAGWGLTEAGTVSDHLLEVDLNKLPLGVCQEAYKDEIFADQIDNKMICAGRIGGGVDTCLGDSGGPLMCQRCSSCEWYLAGITSFGPEQCGQAGKPGMYVNVVSYEGWIIRHTTATQRRTFSC